MRGWNLIAIPYARRRDVTGALRAYLEHDRSSGGPPELEVETVSGRDFLQEPLVPGSRSPRTFACYERPMPTLDDPTTFIVSDGRWDMGLAAAASRAMGGFAVAAESCPLLSCSGLVVFYAGVPVHFRYHDSEGRRGAPARPSSEEVHEAFQRLLKQALSLEGMLLAPMIRPSRATVVDLVRTSDRPGFDPWALPSTPPLHCAFYARVDEHRMAQALGDSPGLTWKVSRTSLDVPYGVVLGVAPSSWEQWMTVQRRTGTQAMGLSLSGLAGLQWWNAGPDRLPVLGVARGAHDLLERAGNFADLLDTNPADLRVPVASAPC